MNTITLFKTCPFCGKKYSKVFPLKEFNAGMRKLKNGELIQNAFPTFTPSEREFLLTGICDNCWGHL